MEWVDDDYRTMTNRKYRSEKQEFFFLPELLLSLKFKCENGHDFYPDWLKKCRPQTPVRAKAGGFFIPVTRTETCNVCGGKVSISLPTQKIKGSGSFFGDEAMRESGENYIVTYSVVQKPTGTTFQEDLFSDLAKAKQKLCPKLNPNAWVIHCKDLHDGRLRKRSSDFSDLSKGDINGFFYELAELISKHKLTVWNAAYVLPKPARFTKREAQDAKTVVYGALLLKVIVDCSESGIMPHLFFERTEKDGWAKRQFNGMLHTMMWPFITKGVPIPTPKFVSPDFDPVLELADFVSFVIARYLFVREERKRGESKDFDIDPATLGHVRYSHVTSKEHTIHATQVGYPTEF